MAESKRGLVPRRIRGLLEDRSEEEPVIALHGPRSVGKSTVLHDFAAEHQADVIDLDNLEVRDAVARNPSAAVEVPIPPVCIDEYQHLPEVLDAIKARLNRTGSEPGTAVLTGSTRHDALPRTAQALTGRLHSMVIWPLAQCEIEGRERSLLEGLLEDPSGTVSAQPHSTTSREEYVERLCAGGLPTPRKRREASRARWFDDYVRTSVERDAVELFRVRQRQALAEILNRLAGQTAQVLNLSKVGEGVGISRETLENYVRLLEDLYLVHRLPAWGRRSVPEAQVSPKCMWWIQGWQLIFIALEPKSLPRWIPRCRPSLVT
ncbi:AAA family ATPase [Nesterenkonia pannonica]|uniref:ATP-binding protein n=1 Tax=Nesterenkonia pannonica TaxID=1548602 RepID=UPI002164549A|nr:AAA family ATPase [Nesterenkonia pannonica]